MRIGHRVSLAEFSTFGIGRRAKYFCLVKNGEEFLEAVVWAKNRGVGWKVFAGGSNVVFPDYDLRYLMICFRGGEIRVIDEVIFADAGVLLSDIIWKSIDLGLSGLEKLAGIPGTLGGAIVGNAGAYGRSIAEIVRNVEIFNGHSRMWISDVHCDFGYRESIFKRKNYVVLQAALKFGDGNKKSLKKISREIVKTREKKYKPGLKCPGSFFKNVLVKDVSRNFSGLIDASKITDGKIPAGYLLDAVGAKGEQRGDIFIADYHANLFINKGMGTAADVYALADILRERVYARFGIVLEEEVRYVY